MCRTTLFKRIKVKKYIPRALWYLALALISLGMFYLPGKMYTPAFFRALFTYFPISILWIFLARIFYLGLKMPEYTFGFPTKKVGFSILFFGGLVTLISVFTLNTSIAPLGILLILAGVEWILMYREGKIISLEGQRSGRY